MAHIFTGELDGLVAAMVAKGYCNIHVELSLKSSEAYAPFRLELEYKSGPDAPRQWLTCHYHQLAAELGHNPAVIDALDHLSAMVAALPSSREQAIKEFVNQMEELKKNAESLGLDADFVNPLMGLMEKLASNALPAPKG